MTKTKLTLTLLLGLCAAYASSQSQPVAVVVSPNNPLNNITMAKLRETFQCERASWPSGERISPFSRFENTLEHEVMLRAIFQMSEADYNQFWVMKQIRGETSCKVTGLPSKGMTIEALKARRGAIALIRLSDVTAEMKVLLVDGRKPDNPAYALQ